MNVWNGGTNDCSSFENMPEIRQTPKEAVLIAMKDENISLILLCDVVFENVCDHGSWKIFLHLTILRVFVVIFRR